MDILKIVLIIELIIEVILILFLVIALFITIIDFFIKDEIEHIFIKRKRKNEAIRMKNIITKIDDEIYSKTMKRLRNKTIVNTDKEAIVALSKEIDYYRNQIQSIEDYERRNY